MPNQTSQNEKQAFEKENKKREEQNKEASRLYCKLCKQEIFPDFRCVCSGGGGGGGGGGGESEEKASKDEGQAPVTGTEQIIEAVGEVGNEDSEQLQLEEGGFNPEVISELLSKKLLVIENDRESGALTIQCDPNLLSTEEKNEVKNFVKAILKELAKFKEENGISYDPEKIEHDHEGNIRSLRISFPHSHPTIYDSFIDRLASKHLLPRQNVEQQEKGKVVYEKGMNHFETPQSAKPTPGTKRKLEHADEEVNKTKKQKTSQEETKTSQEETKSSIRPKTPLDGLKPKGF